MILAHPPLCFAALLAVIAALSVETDHAVILVIPDQTRSAVEGRRGSIDDAVAVATHRFARDGHCWCVVDRWEVAVSTPSAPATALLVTW